MKVVGDRANAGECEDGHMERGFLEDHEALCVPWQRCLPPHPGPFHLPCALMSVSIVRAC